MSATETQNDEIELDLLKSVMRSFQAVPLLYPATCGLIALYLPSTYGAAIVLAWWLVLFATQIEYAIYQRRFFRQAEHDADTWTRASAIRYAIMNLVWICMVPLFWSPDSEIQNLGLITIQTVHALISSILASPRRATMFACSIPNISSVLLCTLYDGSPTFMVLGGASLITYLFLVRMGQQSRQSARNEYSLRQHNRNLITELSRREDRFRALVDNAFDGILVTDIDLRITYASPSIRQIGIKPEQMMGQSIYAFLKPDEAATIKTSVEDMGGETHRGTPLEFHTTSRSGKIHWYEASVSDLRENPNINGYVLNIRDISDRKRSQMELINQSRVLEALAIGAPMDDVMSLVAQGAEQANPSANVAIYLADADLNLTVCASPSFPPHFKQAIFEYWEKNKSKDFGNAITREEGLLALPDLLDFTDQPDTIEFAETFGVRSLWMQQFKASEKAGGSGSIAIYRNIPGMPSPWEKSLLVSTARLAAIAINRRRAEQNLLEATRTAEMANRAKTKFLANMSHELRTPLNAIIGFSDIMKSELFGPLGSPRYSEYAIDINDSGAHLLNVIDDILDISKIEAGRYLLEESEIEIEDVLRWSIEVVRPRTDEKFINVILDMAPNIPCVMADRRAMRQIMLNLLSNAAKFTPENGIITVTAQLEADSSLTLQVTDNGIGIPAEKLDTVLEPFGQVDDSSARMHGGTGLGLSITKSLTELHEGTFRLESCLGEGTSAIVTLPPSRLRRLPESKKAAAD